MIKQSLWHIFVTLIIVGTGFIIINYSPAFRLVWTILVFILSLLTYESVMRRKKNEQETQDL